MRTITLTYDVHNMLANNLIATIKSANVFQITESNTRAKQASIYNESFVNELLASKKSKGVKIKDEDLWEKY